MTRERIEKAVEVINYAIEHQISVKEASVKCGYSDTYIKNIKALVYDGYTDGWLCEEFFTLFNEAYMKYTTQKNTKNQSEPKLGILVPEEKYTNEQTTLTTKGNTAEFNWENKNTIRTIEELLAEAKIDLDLWKVKESTINKWDVTAIIDNVPVTTENFQVKAKLERVVEIAAAKEAGEVFIDMVKNYKPPVLDFPEAEFNRVFNGEKNLLEISLFDLHLGKLCWSGETGENFNIKIASKRFLETIQVLLSRASVFDYDRILFPIGNDFFNSDSILNTTTKGTFQDEDSRFQKTFSAGVKLLVDSINILKQIGVPIDVLIISGNHDFERSYYLGSVLEAWFNEDKQVNVNNSPSPRKYYKYGKVLLGFTHGSEEKESALPMLMASDIEAKPYWSETLFHEFHVGHIHRKRNVSFKIVDTRTRSLNEDLGVTVRYLSSLTGTDAWHHKSGFIGAIKAGDAFVWNDELGLMAHLNGNYNVDN